jgi:L-lactate dehydrogenase complex protein LldG
MSNPADTTASARAAILGDLKRVLEVSGGDDTRRKAVADRLATHRPNLVPERTAIDHGAQVVLFREQAEAVAASVEEIDGLDGVPEAISHYLRTNNLPSRVRHGADEMLNRLPWDKAATLEVMRGAAAPDDTASVSRAFGAVAETGTLVLTSGADNPTSLNFLPESHIVVIEAARITGTYEDVWDKVRAQYGVGTMPRAVNMVSGPSRTADVEQTIQLGAHGPRRLHIIIVGTS